MPKPPGFIVKFERCGDGNWYVFWLENPAARAGYIKMVLADIDDADGKWMSFLDTRTNHLYRRISHESPQAITSNNVPWKLVYALKAENVEHLEYVTWVLEFISHLANKRDPDVEQHFTRKWITDIDKCDQTENKEGPYRSLDEVMVDSSVAQITIGHFFQDRVARNNQGEGRVAEDTKQTFYDANKWCANWFFKRHANGRCSETALRFGHPKAKQETISVPPEMEAR